MNFTSQKEKDDYIAKVKQRIDLVKSKIEQVKAKQSQGEQGDYLGAAKAYMEFDPNTAMSWAGKADERSIKEMSALLKGDTNPDQVRFKLASRLNAISGQLANLPTADPNYDLLTAEQDKIRQELKSDNPSIQNVYNGVTPPVGGGDTNPPPPGTVKIATYETILADIAGATKSNWNAVEQKVGSDIVVAKLNLDNAKSQKDVIDKTLLAKKKELFPAVTVRPKTTSVDWLTPIKSAIADLSLGSNVSALDPTKDSDKQIIWKVNQRGFTPEAVNEGDLNLGRGWLEKAISRVTGVSAPISDEVAKDNLEAIKTRYDNALKTLKSYNDEGNKKYISEGTNKWMNDVINLMTWKGKTSGGTTKILKEGEPNPKDYKGNFPAYQKAVAEYKAKGGKL